jgi:hypothetical protein
MKIVIACKLKEKITKKLHLGIYSPKVKTVVKLIVASILRPLNIFDTSMHYIYIN